MHQRSRITLAAAGLFTASALVLAGCSTGGSTTDAGSTGEPAEGVDLDAARAYIEAYQNADKELTVTEPLSAMPAPGSDVVFLDIGTPVGTQMWEILQPTAEILDINLRRVETGADPQSVNAAVDSVVESKPAAVIAVALDPVLWSNQLDELREEGVTVVAASIPNGDEFGFTTEQQLNDYDYFVESGKVLAAAIIDRTDGQATNFAYYTIPELAFSGIMAEAAEEQMGELCPTCELRIVDIPLAQLGNNAPATIVSDLQAHPETQAFISSGDEMQIGLPAAMSVAGIDVPGMGQTPTSINFQQIRDGEQDSALAVDLNLFMWLLMDQTLREMAGQDLTRADSKTISEMLQLIITADNAPEDAQQGWLAIPDYQEKFTEMWTANA